MAKRQTSQNDLYSQLVEGVSIQVDPGHQARIAIDRLELQLGHASGAQLVPNRVHALSAVRRRDPIFLYPSCPTKLIGRSAELETLRQSVVARHVVDLHGPDGAGKSTLAAALIHAVDANRFPDGAVYATGKFQYQDLLQALFDCFYTSETPIHIADEHSKTYLNNLRALVVLDDVGLGPKELDPVLDALTESAVLVTGAERSALGRGRAVKLGGLSRQAAVEIFCSAASPTPSPEDAPLVEQICLFLNDMPLPVLGIAAQITYGGASVPQVMADLQNRRPWAGTGADPSIGPALEQIVAGLDGANRYLVTLLAAVDGQYVNVETIAQMASLSMADLLDRVRGLHQLGIIQPYDCTKQDFDVKSDRALGERLALVPGYINTVQTWLVDTPARQRVADYYAVKLSRGAQVAGYEIRCLLGALEDCWQQGWLDRFKPIASAAERALGGLRWWAEWQHVLDLTRRVAQSLGDRSQEAWAMHQLGTLLGVAGEFDRSTHLLRTAKGMREALGDTAGAELTSRNLSIIDDLAPVVPLEITPIPLAPETETTAEAAIEDAPPEFQRVQPQQAALPPRVSRRRLAMMMAAIATLVVLLAGAVAIVVVAGIAGNGHERSDLAVSWEFGDAWNALDNTQWTQQIIVVVDDGDDDLTYFVDGEPSGPTFERVLPICDGDQGTISVESSDGRSGTVEFGFDSPFCP
jgi:hypothetical protein